MMPASGQDGAAGTPRSVQRRRKKRPIRPGKARGRDSQHGRAEPDVPELQTRGDLSPLSCSGRRQHRLVLLQSSVASWVRARARPGCGGPSYALGSLIARDQGGEGHELRRQKPSSINPSRLLSRRGGIAHAYIKCLLVWFLIPERIEFEFTTVVPCSKQGSMPGLSWMVT